MPVPALGAVPVNFLAVIAFAILGFREPALWLLGTGLETLFLYVLATNARFQKVVEAQHVLVSEEDAERKQQDLIRTLPPELKRRLDRLSGRCAQAARVLRDQQGDDFTFEANQDALKRLEWVYLKLLVARNNLVNTAAADTEDDLSRSVAELEAEVKQSESEALRRSKSATLAILKERLANIHRRAESLEEIDSDLMRIEAQVELMIENATIQGKPQTISTDIELATNLASTTLFGESESTVADIDQAYRPRSGQQQAERN